MHYSADRPDPDPLLCDLADYVLADHNFSDEAIDTAKWCIIDSVACALLARDYPACTKLIGPTVPGATFSNGAKVLGGQEQLEPVQAAFCIGALIRWLDFNDTWLAAEWGHPSDNLGAILALADYLNRNGQTIQLDKVLDWTIKAYEIQGVLALEHAFNRVGLDHVILVRIASTAVAAAMLGCNREQTINALSNAWLDGGALRTYRHAPNTGSRKSWAAGDATSRGVRLALIAQTGEMGYPSALSATRWGFQDVLFESKPITLSQPLNDYVMRNILFKIAYPAEFHAQTAVEAALHLHADVKDRLEEIDAIHIETQEAGNRIINKTGALDNPADRDHCLQYMVAIPLIYGRLTANDYEDEIANNPMVDTLRGKMTIRENTTFTQDYFDADKRAITNSIQVKYKDGSVSEKVTVEYPIGHRNRREEGIPLLQNKFENALTPYFNAAEITQLKSQLYAAPRLASMNISDFMDLFAINKKL